MPPRKMSGQPRFSATDSSSEDNDRSEDKNSDALLLSSEDLDDMLGLSKEAMEDEQPLSSAQPSKETHPSRKGLKEKRHTEIEADAVENQNEEMQEQKKAKRVLSKGDMLRMKEKAERRGVIYVSRIPPHMKPGKLRQLLSIHGELGRLYCAPEDPSLRRDRKKNGKDTGKNFTEGWVEFEDKRVAKRVAEQLNGQPIGGKRRSAYYFDLWCLKYLSKFRWDHLTEEINYQRAVREQRLAAEISSAKRERDFYLSRVDRARAIDAIQQRKKTKASEQQGAETSQQAPITSKGTKGLEEQNRGRHFRQTRGKVDVMDENARTIADDVLDLVGTKGRKVRKLG